MNKQDMMEKFLNGASTEEMINTIRQRLELQRALVQRMEEGSYPLPLPHVRPFLINTLKEQITECARWEKQAKNEETRKIVLDCGQWAAEALQRLQKLFDAEKGGTGSLAN